MSNAHLPLPKDCPPSAWDSRKPGVNLNAPFAAFLIRCIFVIIAFSLWLYWGSAAPPAKFEDFDGDTIQKLTGIRWLDLALIWVAQGVPLLTMVLVMMPIPKRLCVMLLLFVFAAAFVHHTLLPPEILRFTEPGTPPAQGSARSTFPR